MGAKASFNPMTRVIDIIAAPDGNGEILFDFKQDLYSDGKEDWLANESLRRLRFPIRPVGGDAKPGSQALDSTFFLASDWKIKPFEGSHRLITTGNVFSEDGTSVFVPTVGAFNVLIEKEFSSIVTAVGVDSAGIAQQVWDHTLP